MVKSNALGAQEMAKRSSGNVVVINLRTTEQVRDGLKKLADAEDRSMNWVLDRIVRQALQVRETT